MKSLNDISSIYKVSDNFCNTACVLAKLRHGEFLQFVTNFSELVENNNPSILNVLKQHNDFKVAISIFEPLFKKERVNAFTHKLILLDERRDKAGTGLFTVINGYLYHYDAAVAGAAKLLADSLQIFGSGVTRQNYTAETATIRKIVTNWESKPELTSALVLLGLTEWKNELKSANQAFDRKYLERIDEVGEDTTDTLKEKRAETMAVYYELKKYLDANEVLHNTPAYEKTINKLNVLIEKNNNLLNGRLKDTDVKPAPDVN